MKSANDFMKAQKTLKLLPFLFLIICAGCPLSPGKVLLVSGEIPPTFEFRGRQDLQWIWFRGPFAQDSVTTSSPQMGENSEKIIVWRIAPSHSRFIPLNDVPPITYGQLPTGWEQKFPEQGAPPPLVEGAVYHVSAILVQGNIGIYVLIKDGKVVEYQRKE
jgi:hypothetical protein